MQGCASSDVGIKIPILIEVDDTQLICPSNAPMQGLDITANQPQQGRLPAAIGTNESHAHSRLDHQADSGKQDPAVDGILHLSNSISCFVFCPSGKVDAGCADTIPRIDIGEFADHFHRSVDPRFCLGGARFRTATQPFDLVTHAIRQ